MQVVAVERPRHDAAWPGAALLPPPLLPFRGSQCLVNTDVVTRERCLNRPQPSVELLPEVRPEQVQAPFLLRFTHNLTSKMGKEKPRRRGGALGLAWVALLPAVTSICLTRPS